LASWWRPIGLTSPGTTHFRASLGLLAFIFELILIKMEMMIDLLAKGWLYPLKGAPKPLGELRPVVVLLDKDKDKDRKESLPIWI